MAKTKSSTFYFNGARCTFKGYNRKKTAFLYTVEGTPVVAWMTIAYFRAHCTKRKPKAQAA